MSRTIGLHTTLALGLLLSVCGCMPKMTLEEMKAKMPERPAELDKLRAFEGTWDMTGETTMAGLEETIRTTGTMESTWGGDGRFLTSKAKFTMEGFADMEGVECWTYDTHSKKFRSTWIDSTGATGLGEARIAKDGTWQMRATGHGPFGKTTMKGTVTIIDDDHMEWTWTEYAMGGLMKTMKMHVTSTRRK